MVKKGLCVFGSLSTLQQNKSRSLILPMRSDCGLVCEHCKLFSCYDCIAKIYAAINEKNRHDTCENNLKSYIECKPEGVYRHQKGHCLEYKNNQEKLIRYSFCGSNQKSCNEGSASSSVTATASTRNIFQTRQRKEFKISKKGNWGRLK